LGIQYLYGCFARNARQTKRPGSIHLSFMDLPNSTEDRQRLSNLLTSDSRVRSLSTWDTPESNGGVLGRVLAQNSSLVDLGISIQPDEIDSFVTLLERHPSLTVLRRSVFDVNGNSEDKSEPEDDDASAVQRQSVAAGLGKLVQRNTNILRVYYFNELMLEFTPLYIRNEVMLLERANANSMLPRTLLERSDSARFTFFRQNADTTFPSASEDKPVPRAKRQRI